MSRAVCPYCKKEMDEDGEYELSSSYFCCKCRVFVTVYDMDDPSACTEEEEWPDSYNGEEE